MSDAIKHECGIAMIHLKKDLHYFKKKYGDWILYDPGINKNTYILWLLPLLIFLIGGAIIYKKLIKKI